MKQLPIPENEQIDAMLRHGFHELLHDYVETPPKYDFRKYITVTRQTIISHLVAFPDKAKNYLQHQLDLTKSVNHDIEKIWVDGDDYVIASMDHGKSRDLRRFKTLQEAITELVLVAYGLY